MQGKEVPAMLTNPELVQETIELTSHSLDQRGLALVWERIIAIVVPPGVENGADFWLCSWRYCRVEKLSRK